MPSPGASDLSALIARFRGDVTALCVVPSAAGPLALAVSGGPDSMAMLALAAMAFPDAVIAATMDHGLRRGAAAEAAMVAAWCADRDVPHATLHPAGPVEGASLQAQARAARYRALAHWASGHDAVALATAHHRDDQAETFLMRAARGSGPAGLGGIRPSGTIAGVRVIRPLLGWSRAELRAMAITSTLPTVDDPSNVDPRHDRTHARALLASADWLDPARLANAAAYCAEAATTLDSAADWLWDRVVTTADPLALALDGLPRDIQRRLVRRAIDTVRGRHDIAAPAFDPAAANLEPLLDSLGQGRAATHAGVLVTPRRSGWCFGPAPPRRN